MELEGEWIHTLTRLTNIIRHLLCARHSSNFWETKMKTTWFFMNGGKDKHVREPVLLMWDACARISFSFFICPALSCCVSTGSVLVPFLLQTSFSRGFTKNMKLEAVNPRNPGELCVASVVSVKGRLMWLHLEGMYSLGVAVAGGIVEFVEMATCGGMQPFSEGALVLFHLNRS